eukprot:scaffold108941_cov30-Phaeocystis_antarctica.AAC.1
MPTSPCAPTPRCAPYIYMTPYIYEMRALLLPTSYLLVAAPYFLLATSYLPLPSARFYRAPYPNPNPNPNQARLPLAYRVAQHDQRARGRRPGDTEG